ncbi:MAG: 4-hydroxythreonine-4-phosphate dehydrogenase PdxA [Bacteroidaceae bacterium]|jgi:4-hydroxythreonine-4-phosphate dehydrogenase|nr:4-hydroxythreonine-4-phosphate dehydrogenase PdxA [Bacteroidaceae bacterium]
MEQTKIKIGITQGDVNGIGYEVILKAFENPAILELCTPIVYGSPKVMTYHRKALELETSFSIVNSAADAVPGRLNVVNCNDDEVKVEMGKPSRESGKAAFEALEKAMAEYKEGMYDVLVTAPIHKQMIQSDSFAFPGHTEYIEQSIGEGKALMILANETLRVALVTGHVPVAKIASAITQELIEEKLTIFNASLKTDFGIGAPRIAVLALNPHAGDGGVIGKEEETIITPAIKAMREQGILCYGPFPADGFMGSGAYNHFDGVLAMYHDQGLVPFKVLAMENGVNFTAGLPIVRTSPDHGTAFDIAGKNMASPDSFRQALYMAIDIYRNRKNDSEARSNPLRKLYFEKRDDSDKLKLE